MTTEIEARETVEQHLRGIEKAVEERESKAVLRAHGEGFKKAVDEYKGLIKPSDIKKYYTQYRNFMVKGRVYAE